VIVRDSVFVEELGREIDLAVAASREVVPGQYSLAGWRRSLRRKFVAGCARLYLRIAGATGKY
jgi:cardiolipin synthase